MDDQGNRQREDEDAVANVVRQDRGSLHGATGDSDHLDPLVVGPAETIRISELAAADSPRLTGQDPQHTAMLVETANDLPPILVHRQTMKIIDGMHRLEAATLRGDREITVRYFDGNQDEAFVLAVQANTTHGLPLSLADREAAAVRIAASRPYWSDRIIAGIAGLAAATVGALRRRSGLRQPSTSGRIGKDGKVRPLSSVEGRRAASKVIAESPDTPLREVAKAAGISVGTARDVRERMRHGKDPVPDGILPSAGDEESYVPPQRATAARRTRDNTHKDSRSALPILQKDPSLRCTDAGRSLLRCLTVLVLGMDRSGQFVEAVPVHCAGVVADMARNCAHMWESFADKLDEKAYAGGPAVAEKLDSVASNSPSA